MQTEERSSWQSPFDTLYFILWRGFIRDLDYKTALRIIQISFLLISAHFHLQFGVELTAISTTTYFTISLVEPLGFCNCYCSPQPFLSPSRVLDSRGFSLGQRLGKRVHICPPCSLPLLSHIITSRICTSHSAKSSRHHVGLWQDSCHDPWRVLRIAVRDG